MQIASTSLACRPKKFLNTIGRLRTDNKNESEIRLLVLVPPRPRQRVVGLWIVICRLDNGVVGRASGRERERERKKEVDGKGC